ncbi:hypothetical protein C6497_06835 [Candidatus Poribacteria bacterium]|nr:MAG: hypothetical protein C6497_06835 [Candidatus Poribacteria bacterium]
MMTMYKNDPKYKIFLSSKNRHYSPFENVKIRNDNKTTKLHILQILKKLIQSGVKLVYDRG